MLKPAPTTTAAAVQPEKPPAPSSRWMILLSAVAIVVAALAAYHNSFGTPFTLDDEHSIVENPTIRHLWPIWQALSPSPNTMLGGRPVVNLSLAVNYALGGVSPWGYHVVNLAVHILASLTLFGIVRRTVLQPALRPRFGGSAVPLALTTAVLWAVHPLQTEAVTYVSQRAESLMGLFYLLTLYCFVRGIESQSPKLWFTLSIVACALGMATKEVMVSAPLMVMFYDWTFIAGGSREVWKKRWRLYAGLASTWLLLALFTPGLNHRGVGYGLGVTWWAYGLTECRVIIVYLRLAVWPHPLIFDYGPNIILRQAIEAVPYALVLLLLITGSVIAMGRRSMFGFLGVWFLAILAPASSLVPVAGQPMAEHRMYLSLAAVVVVLVLGIHALLGQHSLAVFLMAALGLGFLTVRRNEDYRSAVAIWTDTVTKCPGNARALYNLGTVLLRCGQASEAVSQYEKALQIVPDNPEVHNNLGNALSELGRPSEAISEYQAALRLNPDYAEAHNNLGIVLVQEGRASEAIEHYTEALRINPDSAEAHNNWGLALVQLGKAGEAVDQYREALRIKTDYFEAHFNLGVALFQLGRLPEAAQQYEDVVRLKPNFVEAHNNLGIALAQLGRRTEARTQFEEALRLKPDYLDAQSNLVTLQSLPQTANPGN